MQGWNWSVRNNGRWIVLELQAGMYNQRWNASTWPCIVQADVANLETSISLSGYRIELKIFGFSEKLPALARKIASHMKTLTTTELDFEVATFFIPSRTCSVMWCSCRNHECDGFCFVAHAEDCRGLSEEYSRANEKPIDHATYLSTEALSKRFWSIDLRRDCLHNLTFQDFTKFVANLFSKVSSSAYHGVSYLVYLCFSLD